MEHPHNNSTSSNKNPTDILKELQKIRSDLIVQFNTNLNNIDSLINIISSTKSDGIKNE